MGRVPVPELLRGYLETQLQRTGGEMWVFAEHGRTFDPRRVGQRAKVTITLDRYGT